MGRSPEESEVPVKEEPLSKPTVQRSKFETLLDWISKIFAVVGGIAMIYVTYHFSQVASDLSKQNIEMVQSQRLHSIQPALEVLSGINYTKDYSQVIVPVRNYGTGTALGLRTMTAFDGDIHGLVHHQFTTVGDSLITGGSRMANEQGTQQEMFTLGQLRGKDWVAPGETVQFAFDPWAGADKPEDYKSINPSREFTIFLSFFDVDHNEYLTISKMPISGRSGLIMLATGSQGLTDSVLSLSAQVRLFNSRTFYGLHFRSETGGFRVFAQDTAGVPGDHQSP